MRTIRAVQLGRVSMLPVMTVALIVMIMVMMAIGVLVGAVSVLGFVRRVFGMGCLVLGMRVVRVPLRHETQTITSQASPSGAQP